MAASYVKDHFSFHTIRCASCELLLPSTSTHARCDPCMAYRKVLNSMLSRKMKLNTDDSCQAESHTNLRFLSTPQRKVRFGRMRVRTKVCQQQSKRLRERLESVIGERGVQVTEELHEDLVTTMENSTPGIVEQYPPDSFRRIFWEQQQCALSLKDARSMRWEPAMIR